MKVAEKYKQTEVGLIPSDWEVQILENLSTKIGDGIHSTPIYSTDGEYYFVNGNNLLSGKIFISEDTKRVSKEQYLLNKREINQNTVFLSINGTIGNVAFYNDEKIILGKSAAYINLNDKIVKGLFYQLIQTEFIKRYFDNELTGSTIKNLGLSSIRNTPIPLPPTKAEQTAIATALSDADALISSLEKLIAKKRMIKQGAMQQLLQPKDGWEVKKLGEVADMFSGGTPLTSNANFYNGGIPWVVIADITKAGKYIVETEKTISNEGLLNSSAKLFNSGVLLFAMYASIGKTTIALMDTTCNQAILGIQPHSIDKEYLYYFLSFNERKFATMGQTGTQSNLSKDMVRKIEIPYPTSAEEQIRIATILSDMDAEIAAMEAKLEKYRKVKTGMMQNLLTGKIRLV
ncbi:MAG: restriction endonuclease subunit S [Verrucomicrobia bacterium]|nr:restriction endonuclease subunit S [Verrucomicrobiota bacterium]